jgi:hypothetical protein
MKRHRSYRVLFVLALASTSATAFADPPKDPPRPAPSAAGYSYTFTDDALLAGATGVLGVPIKSRPPGIRATLIRPRTAFIVELLKSVENL